MELGIGVITTEEIQTLVDAGLVEKKPRVRSGAPNRSSEANIRAFVAKMAAECPYFIGGDSKHFEDASLPAETLLSRIVAAIEYTPSSIELLADQKGLMRKGFLIDSDLTRMTLRNIADHCSKPMLDELAGKMREHEAHLVQLLADPSPNPEPVPVEVVPKRETAIVNDEMLGRIEIDVETAAVLRVVPDSDAMGDILVDDAGQVEVNADTETAKQSNIWGSW